ncbi:MAG: FAD-dependent monooxygenase, partial [Cyanobacteriota bacterium]
MVGAGPCGAALALLLVRSGWAVTLVDSAPPQAPRPNPGEGGIPSGVGALAAQGRWARP